MKNTDFRKIWTGVAQRTPLGSVWVAVSDKGMVALQIGVEEGNFTQKLAARFGILPIPSEVQVMPILHQIEAYLQGMQTTFEILICWGVMSNFQRKALRAVYAIPYGETRTYGQIAAQIGAPRASRAVGRANATNPIPLVIPCHRVIAANGSLRGYGAGEGIKTKAWLLDLEKNTTRKQ